MPVNDPANNDPIIEETILTDGDQFLAMALAMNRFREAIAAMLDGKTDHDKLAWYFALRSLVRDTDNLERSFAVVGDAYLDLWYAIKKAHDIDPKDFHGKLPDGAKRKRQ